MPIFLNQGGSPKAVTDLHINQGGSPSKVCEVWVNQGGTPVLVYSCGPTPPPDFIDPDWGGGRTDLFDFQQGVNLPAPRVGATFLADGFISYQADSTPLPPRWATQAVPLLGDYLIKVVYSFQSSVFLNYSGPPLDQWRSLSGNNALVWERVPSSENGLETLDEFTVSLARNDPDNPGQPYPGSEQSRVFFINTLWGPNPT